MCATCDCSAGAGTVPTAKADDMRPVRRRNVLIPVVIPLPDADVHLPPKSSDSDPFRTAFRSAYTLFDGENYVEEPRFTSGHVEIQRQGPAAAARTAQGRHSDGEGARINRRRIRPRSLGDGIPDPEAYE